jgi:hypothetical protein
MLQWTEGTSQDIPVTGYRIYSDKGLPGNSVLVYDGDGTTQILEYADTGLEAGVTYSYTLEVLNFNGPSDKSTLASRSACVVPSLFNSLEVSAT